MSFALAVAGGRQWMLYGTTLLEYAVGEVLWLLTLQPNLLLSLLRLLVTPRSFSCLRWRKDGESKHRRVAGA